MKLIELFILTEGTDFEIIHKSWVKGKKIYPVTDTEHGVFIDDNPELFAPAQDNFDAVENGWIRATYEMLNGKKTFHVEGLTGRNAARAVRYYIDKFPEIQNVNVDVEDQGAFELTGNDIDKFARTGRVPRDARSLFVGM